VLPSVAFLSTSPLPRWIPNPLEVSAVFDYPLNAFLHKTPLEEGGRMWYQGSWISWHAGEHWRMHKFYVPTLDDDEAQHYKVWGMTARMLVDAARIAYDQEPEFEHMTTLGDEVLIGRLVREGVMGEKGASALGDEEGRGRVEEGEEGVHRTSIGAKI
jgi:hypothetical protein